jgi:predicted MFS family arabinose efflux permease
MARHRDSNSRWTEGEVASSSSGHAGRARWGGESPPSAPRLLVPALALLVTVSYGALFYGFSVLVTDEAAGGAFSATVLSAAYGGAVLSAGAFAVAAGWIADRAGIRGVVAVGAAAGAGGLAAFSMATEGWQVLLVWWVLLGAAMAGTLYEPAYVAIQQWVAPGRRAHAIALLTLMAGLSGPTFIPLTTALVDGLGWRHATLVLAALLGALGLATAALALPSGSGRSVDETPSVAASLASQLTAFKRPRLLTFTLGAVLAYGALEATLIHRIARFEDAGFALSTIAFWAAVSGLLTLPGRFVLPVLGGRRSATSLLAGVLAVLAVATAFMVPGNRSWQLIAYFTLFGLVFGAALPLRAVAMSNWYAVAGFGTLMGIQSAMIAAARAGGPPLVGWLHDALDGYAAAFAVLTALFFLGATLVLASGRLGPD